MHYVKKHEPHPSKLPELSDAEIVTLEAKLRERIDSWAMLQIEQEEDHIKKVQWSSWIAKRSRGIRKLAATMQKGTGRIGKTPPEPK